MDDLIDSLPTLEELKERGLPPTPTLSEAEIEQAKADRKSKRSRHYIKNKTEAWTKRILVGLLNGIDIEKNRDDLRYNPKTNTHYRVSTGVDYSGKVYLLVNGRPRRFDLEVEVKGVNSGSFPIKNLSTKEIQYLNEGRNVGLSFVSLVWCINGVVDVGYLIPWRAPGQPKRGTIQVPDWADILDYLERQAARDKRFKGQSIRECDLPFLESLSIRKVSGKWTLPPWLAVLIPPATEMLPGIY